MNHSASEEPSARKWLSALDRVFAAASKECGVQSVVLGIFERRVRLLLVGHPLRERLLPAFRHLMLPADSGPVDLTIKLWDGAASDKLPPPPPWPQSSYAARSEVLHGLKDCALEVSFQTESGTLEVFAAELGLAYCWVRSVATWPLWQSAAPLRTTLGHFARTAGGQLVHGAAVGTADGAVLLSAPGGSGKSTTALACLQAALLYLGDDYVYLSQALPRRVFGIYATAKLRHDGVAPMPELTESWQRQDGESKSLLYLHPRWQDQLALSLPLRAVLIPAIAADARTRLRPATAREALHALAPTTVFQLPGSDPAVFRALAELVRGIPAYRLELGPRPAEAAAVIAQLLSASASVSASVPGSSCRDAEAGDAAG